MSIFNIISNLINPISKTIDELHFSGQEKGEIEVKKAELKGKLAELEAKISTKMLDLQSQALEANTKIAVAEQQHGSAYVKAVRPTLSILSFVIIILMGLEVMPYKQLIVQICGAYLGVYAGLRTYEKKGK